MELESGRTMLNAKELKEYLERENIDLEKTSVYVSSDYGGEMQIAEEVRYRKKEIYIC